jgi:uncharacterized membrane protein YbhN (UPF0104 family)
MSDGMRLRRDRPILNSALATAIAAGVVLALAHITGADAIGRAFDHMAPGWIALLAVAELLTYPAYGLAYRSIARVEGHAPIELGTVARVVVAGFGPYSIGGGFGVDKRVLEALDADPESARRRVVALGTMEWVLLAPLGCVVSIILIVQGANVLPSLVWPWALSVPAGFAAALWATAGHRVEWLRTRWGGRLAPVCAVLEGVGMLRVLVLRGGEFLGAWLGIALYWAADIIAFWAALRMFGLDPGALKIVIAYATGYAATRRSLPLGGAGVTEFLMTYSLYWLRYPLAPALAAVLAYRVFNFGLVAVPALIARRQLQPVISGVPGMLRREALAERARRAAEAAERAVETTERREPRAGD